MTADNVAIPFGEIKNVRPREDQRIVHTICQADWLKIKNVAS